MVEQRPDKSDRPVLMDFGLARDASATEHLTETGMVMGTPAYMAPEQAQGDHSRIDLRADVYGIGAVLYEMLCGQTPFIGQSTVQVLLTVMNDDAVPLRRKNSAIPVDVETIVMKCLSKEPPRRYESALALADDLGRFLAGEPIAARQTTWSYRVLKKARKHRTLVALSGLLLLSLITLLAVFVRARWQAAEQRRLAAAQAQLAQRLGQDVKEMELFMRAAYALPLHDIDRERQVVRRRMQQIEKLLQTLDPATRGPAYYALGRGYLVLHEPTAARQQLEQALAAGYQTPETHEALGRTLAALYGQALDRLTYSLDYQSLSQRKLRIQEELLQPALRELEKGHGAQTDSLFIRQALQSWLRRDMPALLSAAQQAEAEAPWLSEPLLLQTKAARQLRYHAEGKAPSDTPGSEHIAELFARLTDIARSDPEAYGEAAKFWLHQMFEALISHADVRTALAHLKTACERGTQSDPRSKNFHSMLAGGYSYLARWEQQSGRDPQASAQQAIAMVEAALQQTSSYDFLHILGNNLHMVTAEYRSEHGLDPLPDMERAITSSQRGIALHPGHWILHHDLFVAYLVRVDYLLHHGGDPEPSLRAAGQTVELTAKLEDGAEFAALDRVDYYQAAAEVARLRGQDAAPLLDKFLLLVREQVRVHQHNDQVLTMFTSALLTQVPRRLAAGESVQALFAEIAPLIEQRLREFPLNPDGFVDRAKLCHGRAEVQLLAGHSPLDELRQGQEALETARQLKPGRRDIQLQQGKLCLLQAEWLRTQRRPSVAARRCIEQAVAGSLGGAPSELLLILSQALRLQTMGPGVSPQISAEQRKRAAQAVATARTLTPQFPAVDAEDAALRLQQAQRARPTERRPLASESLRLLTGALQRDPTLVKRYGALRETAQILSAASPAPAAGR